MLLLGDGTVRMFGSDGAGQATPPAGLGPVYHVGAGGAHTVLNTRRMCADVDECAEGSDECADGQVCTNVPGHYKCAAPAGCDPNPFAHGDCQETGRGVVCVCEKFWFGALCDTPVHEAVCDDGLDEEQDGLVDCKDPDCVCDGASDAGAEADASTKGSCAAEARPAGVAWVILLLGAAGLRAAPGRRRRPSTAS